MNFSLWLENQNLGEFLIPANKLYGSVPKIKQTLEEIARGELSQSNGEPIIVSRLDNPRGAFFMIDGYHRVIEGLMKNKAVFDGIINPHLPRIERAGGAYDPMIREKIPMTQAMSLMNSPTMPQNHSYTNPASHAQNSEDQHMGTGPNSGYDVSNASNTQPFP